MQIAAGFQPNLEPFDRQDSCSQATDTSVLDINTIQASHYSMAHGCTMVHEARWHRPDLPAINSEACYEGIENDQFGRNDAYAQRYLVWTCMPAGAAGHTYGTIGICSCFGRQRVRAALRGRLRMARSAPAPARPGLGRGPRRRSAPGPVRPTSAGFDRAAVPCILTAGRYTMRTVTRLSARIPDADMGRDCWGCGGRGCLWGRGEGG